MKIVVLENSDGVVRAVADRLEKLIREKPGALICIAGGHSPVKLMQTVAADAKAGKFNAREFKFVSLDEWVGMGPDDAGSCIYDVGKYFLKPLGIERGERMFFFDGLSDDPDGECRQAAEFIDKNGGIDFIVLGIGMNGHIGFNEPGSSFDSDARVVALDETSKTVGVKYFEKDHELEQGITIGIRQIMDAKEAVLIAMGDAKAEILYKALCQDPSPEIPASVMQLHKNSVVYADKDAAKKLT
jgi:glucosamine-6-phosphate isomerase